MLKDYHSSNAKHYEDQISQLTDYSVSLQNKIYQLQKELIEKNSTLHKLKKIKTYCIPTKSSETQTSSGDQKSLEEIVNQRWCYDMSTQTASYDEIFKANLR